MERDRDRWQSENSHPGPQRPGPLHGHTVPSLSSQSRRRSWGLGVPLRGPGCGEGSRWGQRWVIVPVILMQLASPGRGTQ